MSAPRVLVTGEAVQVAAVAGALQQRGALVTEVTDLEQILGPALVET